MQPKETPQERRSVAEVLEVSWGAGRLLAGFQGGLPVPCTDVSVDPLVRVVYLPVARVRNSRRLQTPAPHEEGSLRSVATMPDGSPNQNMAIARRATWRAVPMILAAGLFAFHHAAAEADPYLYSAAVIDKSGTDADGDGFFETYEFTIEIDADVGSPLAAEVGAIIWCLTTGDGFYVDPWTITANATDPVYVHFTDGHFAVPEPSLLLFEVELYDGDYAQYYPPSWHSLPGEPIRADGPGCNSAWLWSAEITDLAGTDADSNGCFETFSFGVSVDANAPDGCTTDVAARITCTTTGEVWQIEPWTIAGSELDPQSVPFTEEDFELSGPAELRFTIALHNSSFTAKHDEVAVSGVVNAERPACDVSLAGAAIQNLRNEVDSDADGFLEECDFDIAIDADTSGCPAFVVAEVNCPATGQRFESRPWRVSGDGTGDGAVLTLNCSQFALTGPAELSFTVQIRDAVQGGALTGAAAVSGGVIPVEPSDWTGRVEVHGTVRYKYRDGTLRPVRYAWVEIREGHVVKSQTNTDGDGEYRRSFPVSQPADIHIRVKTRSVPGGYPSAPLSIAAVKDPTALELYYAESEPLPNCGNSRQIDLVIGNTGATAGAFHVFDSVVEGYHQAATWLGSPPLSEASVLWPDEATFCGGVLIHLLELDRWDRDVIMREYGRFLAGWFGLFQSPGGAHAWDRDLRTYAGPRGDLEAAQLAFCEAWPTFFAVAAQYADTGDTRYDDTENADVSVCLESDTENHHSPGEYYESMIACAWWDMIDDHDAPEDSQDTLCLPISDIWTLLTENQPDTMSAFWEARQISPACRVRMRRVLRDHGMSFLPDGCTVRVASNTPPADFVLTGQNSEPIRGAATAVYTDMPPGDYTVSWIEAPCRIAPPDSTRTALPGQRITFSGTFGQADCSPPEPNGFAAVRATAIDRISITSQAATDDSPPVHYRIEAEFRDQGQWVIGAGGANNYGWSETRPDEWVDAGLLENALYRYKHYVRDSAPAPNTGGPAFATVATLLDPPADSELAISNITATGAVVSVAAPPMPSGAGGTAAYFDIITGEGAGAGAIDRPWPGGYFVQYEDLLPDTEYGWKVRYRSYDGNVTADNPTEKKIRTPAATPGRPDVVRVSGASISLGLEPGGNPSHTLFAIKCTATDPTDDSYEQRWLDECGRASAGPLWRTAEQWEGASAIGLQHRTSYWFAAGARNATGEETALGQAAGARTSVAGDANGDCRVNILDMLTIRVYLTKDPCSNPGAASADLNADGKVNILDMLYCRSNLNRTCTDE